MNTHFLTLFLTPTILLYETHVGYHFTWDSFSKCGTHEFHTLRK